MKKYKTAVIILSVFIGVLAVAAITVSVMLFVVNKWGVTLRIRGDDRIVVEALSGYEDEGASATFGGTRYFVDYAQLEVKTESNVDISVPGIYTVKYSAVHGKYYAEGVRTIVVEDTTAPDIALCGDEEMKLYVGDEWNDPGAEAEDGVDGDLTGSIAADGEPDMKKAGEYVITYSVSDKSGNTASVSRTVTVKEKPVKKTKKTRIEPPAHKVVYLTFDDGPSKYTESLLKILKKYDVKATFFVTDFGDTSIIKKEYDAGHSIGIHTQSHDYSLIYKSTESYWADFAEMRRIVKRETGMEPVLMRFPGGSSNTVSKKYCPGIMTELVKEAAVKGYTYFDWNVSSGDAGETTETKQVYKNVVSGIKDHDKSVVLMHDTKGFSVDAVEEIIKWGQKNGYTFCPLYEDSPTAHHGVNN